MTISLLYGDPHHPFQDKRALNVVKALVDEIQPDNLIHMGDNIDAYQISDFDKEPTRRESLQDEIDLGFAHLTEMKALTRDAKCFYLEGNHEHRLTRTINRMSKQQREIAKLNVFQEHIHWPGIMEHWGLKGWEFVPYRGQARERILPKMILKHGTVARKWSAMTARAEWERYGRSGASGHSHRLGVFYHGDYNGAHGWAETGCLCSLEPDYVSDPDWQHGCVIVTHVGKWFGFESVYIQQGVGIWRGEEYRG